MNYSYLDRNIEKIKNRIAAAAERCGRNKDEITFMAAIKSADVDEINYIYDSLGVCDVGENRVQQEDFSPAGWVQLLASQQTEIPPQLAEVMNKYFNPEGGGNE